MGDLPAMIEWVMLWDGVLVVASIGLLWCTVRFGSPRRLGWSESQGKSEVGAEAEPAAVEAAFIGD